MTYEEAISILTKDRALCLFNPLTGDVEPLNEDCRMSAEAMNLAIEALGKRIAKKPRETRCALMCSSCGHKITEKGCKKLNRLYCKKCGQALDWSDNE